jgi:hypothetical protein
VRPGSLSKLEGLRELWGASKDQVVAVEGDLAKTRLGVRLRWIKAHAGKIDHFFHLAAIYDMQADAESQRESNVNGTRQALALARALKAGCFHHVSSIAAAGLYEGTFTEDMFEEAGTSIIPTSSPSTNPRGWCAKRRTFPGASTGRAWSSATRRPVRWTRSTAPITSSSLLHNLSQGHARWLPLVMNKAGLLNIVPVDFVVDAMDYLAHLPGTTASAFFITDPEGIRVGDLLRSCSRWPTGRAARLRI